MGNDRPATSIEYGGFWRRFVAFVIRRASPKPGPFGITPEWPRRAVEAHRRAVLGHLQAVANELQLVRHRRAGASLARMGLQGWMKRNAD